MPHVLRVLPDVDRVDLMARGRQDCVVPCPGFSWSGSCLVVSAPGPVRWPEVEDLGACTFAGVLDDVLPPRVGPRPLAHPEDPTWVAAAQEVAQRWPFNPYVWTPDGWRCRMSGRRPQPHTVTELLRRTQSTYIHRQRHDDFRSSWQAWTADSPVVWGHITAIAADGTWEVLAPFRQHLGVPADEQLHPRSVGAAVALRLQWGRRATEYDRSIPAGVVSRLAGRSVADPLWNGWLYGTIRPVYVLVSRADYVAWNAARTGFAAITGRPLIPVQDWTRPEDLVRQVLRWNPPVQLREDGLHIAVQGDTVGPWVTQHRQHLFVLRSMLDRRVIIDSR